MNVKPTREVDEYTFLYGDPEKTWHVMRFEPETELYQIAERSPQRERTMEDPETEMDLRRLRERFPHLTVLGGINSFTLHRGTKEEVIEEPRSALEIAKEFGSIVVGCSNQVVAGTPAEDLWAMVETVKKHR